MKSRPHISLDVTDLEASIRFYSAVFGIKPTKQRDDYANFRSLEPPLHLALVSQLGHQHNPSPNSTSVSSYLKTLSYMLGGSRLYQQG
ncbi:MAG: VOC family protein [Chroococcidiopsidaceae cyanobacterium CP_BM_RX_35]|nr:VOC family protein [Chroococcidiopsidaceae cyanobacterium CP_BM_RX_35]